MRSGSGGSVALITVVGYSLAMGFLAIAISTWGDRNALGMLLAFGPRWLLVFPWFLLVPLAAMRSRTLLLSAVGGAVMTLGYVSGFEVPTPGRLWQGAGAGPSLRVVTYNADQSIALAPRLAHDLLVWDADVVVMQDCAPTLAAALRDAVVAPSLDGEPPYQLYVSTEFCFVSRLPTMSSATYPRDHNFGRALAMRVMWHGNPIDVITVHLPSPRIALWTARQGSMSRLESSIAARSRASGALARWALDGHADRSLIVAGDFNLTPASRPLRADWSVLRNAFSDAGWGFGHTMFEGRHRVRIDHVLHSPTFAVRRVHVLSGYPSDHQPVMVDLTFSPPPSDAIKPKTQ